MATRFVRSWSSIVADVHKTNGDPANGPPVPVYSFSNGRQFFERSVYGWALDIEKRTDAAHLVTPENDHIVTPDGVRIPRPPSG